VGRFAEILLISPESGLLAISFKKMLTGPHKLNGSGENRILRKALLILHEVSHILEHNPSFRGERGCWDNNIRFQELLNIPKYLFKPDKAIGTV